MNNKEFVKELRVGNDIYINGEVITLTARNLLNIENGDYEKIGWNIAPIIITNTLLEKLGWEKEIVDHNMYNFHEFKKEYGGISFTVFLVEQKSNGHLDEYYKLQLGNMLMFFNKLHTLQNIIYLLTKGEMRWQK